MGNLQHRAVAAFITDYLFPMRCCMPRRVIAYLPLVLLLATGGCAVIDRDRPV